MANVYDYLQWRGDLTFEERPFNDADNVILSTLVYLDFSGIVPGLAEAAGVASGKKAAVDGHDTVGLARACRELVTRAGGDVRPFVRSLAKVDTRFVEMLAASRRFAEARLGSYVDVVDTDRFLQFGAMTIDLPHEGRYVAFRGTDNTLVGWQENLMLSYTVTAGQERARSYLEQVLLQEASQGVTIRVGGHSKGGNLAEYAAGTCPEFLRKRILRVYSNDGPGMAPEVVSVSPREVLGSVFRHIVPAYSVVGMLFAREGDPRVIVRSNASGIEQHDPTTWQLLPSGVEEASALEEECLVINQAIASWAKGLPLDERESATADIFAVLQAGGATTLDEVASTPERLQQVLRALRETDERTHEVALALAQSAVNSSVESVRTATRNAIKETRARVFALR